MQPPDESRCPECGSWEGAHKLGCSELEKLRTATVDGEPARIVDGPLLVEHVTTDEEVLAALARSMESEARARTEANRAKNALSAAVKRTKAAAEHAAAHWARSRQVEMVFTTGGTEPDDDDEGDEAE
jgi:hypothetical protein